MRSRDFSPQPDDESNEPEVTPPSEPDVKEGLPTGRAPLSREEWPPVPLIALGRFLRPHGIRGELRVYPYTRTADELVEECPDDVLVWSPRSGTSAHRVETIDAHQNIVLLALEGIATRNDAETLRNAFLCIREEERWALAEREYYIDELAGLDVRDAESGVLLGTVVRVTDGAAHDYLEVARSGVPKPILIPFIGEFVRCVDVAARRVDVRLPTGLLDLDNSPPDDE